MLKGQLSWLPFHFLLAISQHSLVEDNRIQED